jgi:hypothetical protein
MSSTDRDASDCVLGLFGKLLSRREGCIGFGFMAFGLVV